MQPDTKNIQLNAFVVFPTKELPALLKKLVYTRKRTVYLRVIKDGSTHSIQSSAWDGGSRNFTVVYKLTTRGFVEAELEMRQRPSGFSEGFKPGEAVELGTTGMILEGGTFRGKEARPSITMVESVYRTLFQGESQ